MAGYQNKRIQTKHHEILRRAHLGQSNVTIANELGIHKITVGLILRSSLAQAELQRLRNADIEKTTNTPARVKLAPQLNEAAELSLQHHLKILKDEVIVSDNVKARISSQHVTEGIYKTEENVNEAVSFRDIIRGLAKFEQAIEERSSNIINITPPVKSE